VKVERLTIQNFRGIGELSLDFDGLQNTTALVGMNGSGKSTIIECLAKVFAIFVSPWLVDRKRQVQFEPWDIKKGSTGSQIEASVVCSDGRHKWRSNCKKKPL
jgi:DNA repair exonuclease SbcCD ATPase subunit